VNKARWVYEFPKGHPQGGFAGRKFLGLKLRPGEKGDPNVLVQLTHVQDDVCETLWRKMRSYVEVRVLEELLTPCNLDDLVED
jgi:hypothetical protein